MYQITYSYLPLVAKVTRISTFMWPNTVLKSQEMLLPKNKMRLKALPGVLILVFIITFIFHGNQWKPHRKTRDLVLVFPGTGYPAKGDKWVIYFCDEDKRWCGGLADRLKGLTLVYFISQITDRKFGIHMKYPDCDYTYFFNLDSFDISSFKGKTSERHIYTDDTSFYNKTRTIDFDVFFTKEILFIRGNLDYWDNLKMNPLYQRKLYSLYPNYTYDQIFKSFFPKIFPLGAKLNRKFEEIMNEAKRKLISKLACAHIRLGISETMPNEHVVRATQSDSQKVLELLNYYKNAPDYKIFVMSDSASVVQTSKQKFQGKFIEVIVGKVLHFELYEGDRDDICPAFERTILEHRVLSECDTLIISKSGLSRTAAYTRSNHDNLFCLHKSEIKPCLPSQLREFYDILG